MTYYDIVVSLFLLPIQISVFECNNSGETDDFQIMLKTDHSLTFLVKILIHLHYLFKGFIEYFTLLCIINSDFHFSKPIHW